MGFLPAVDLKYIICTQILQVTYENHQRQFSVVSISANRSRSERDEDLAHDLESLSIDSQSRVWTVGWDTVVSICGNDTHNDVPPSHKVL